MELRSHCGGLLVLALACALTGCPSSTPPPPPPSATDEDDSASATPLRILVVDDPALAEAVQAQWQAISEQPIDLRTATAAELDGQAKLLNADVILFPTAHLGTLVERRQVVPVPDDVWNGTRLDRRDLLDLARQREPVWGETIYALPLGSRQLSLWYRADLFEQLGIEPPKTWGEYQQIAARLAAREALGAAAPPADAPWSGSLEPLGSDWGGSMLLVRAAAYARHRSQYSTLFDFSTMEPLLTEPPFVQALEELVACAKLAPADTRPATPDDVRRALIAGRAGMALTWPSAASGEDASAGAPAALRLGVATVPGSRTMYNVRQKKWEERRVDEGTEVPVVGLSGRLGATTRECRRSRAAWNFLLLLANADWSTSVLAKSPATGIIRREQIRSSQSWVGADLGGDALRQYTDVLQETHRQSTWFMTIRIPGRDQYMAALNDAVQTALRGEATPTDALQAAADQWRKITADRGVPQQRTAYRRDLGLEK